MANHFTIKIKCKKYVKAYLEKNCGSPVNLQHLPYLLQEFRRYLSKEPESMEKADLTRYEETVTIIIPPDMFYRYGWEMDSMSQRNFGLEVERRVKFFMRQFIGASASLGVSVAECIREFQERFGFYEEIWSFETIKKDFDRNGSKIELPAIKTIRNELNRLLLSNLRNAGGISETFRKAKS